MGKCGCLVQLSFLWILECLLILDLKSQTTASFFLTTFPAARQETQGQEVRYEEIRKANPELTPCELHMLPSIPNREKYHIAD